MRICVHPSLSQFFSTIIKPVILFVLQQMNGTVEQESRTKEGSPIILSHSRLSDHGKALENGETKVNSFYCDSCEKADFASEMELLVHKKVFHHKSPSPRRVSNFSMIRILFPIHIMKRHYLFNIRTTR